MKRNTGLLIVLAMFMTAASVPAVCASMLAEAQDESHACCQSPEEGTSCADLCAESATPHAIDIAPAGSSDQPATPPHVTPAPPSHLKIKAPVRLAADDPSLSSPPLKRYLHACTLRL